MTVPVRYNMSHVDKNLDIIVCFDWFKADSILWEQRSILGFLDYDYFCNSTLTFYQELEIRDSFENGPFSVLTKAVKNQQRILISCRNNKKLLANVIAFDHHTNLVLENVIEMWKETVKGESQMKERFISKLFLRGDSVIMVVPNPLGEAKTE